MVWPIQNWVVMVIWWYRWFGWIGIGNIPGEWSDAVDVLIVPSGCSDVLCEWFTSLIRGNFALWWSRPLRVLVCFAARTARVVCGKVICSFQLSAFEWSMMFVFGLWSCYHVIRREISVLLVPSISSYVFSFGRSSMLKFMDLMIMCDNGSSDYGWLDQGSMLSVVQHNVVNMCATWFCPTAIIGSDPPWVMVWRCVDLCFMVDLVFGALLCNDMW